MAASRESKSVKTLPDIACLFISVSLGYERDLTKVGRNAALLDYGVKNSR